MGPIQTLKLVLPPKELSVLVRNWTFRKPSGNITKFIIFSNYMKILRDDHYSSMLEGSGYFHTFVTLT